MTKNTTSQIVGVYGGTLQIKNEVIIVLFICKLRSESGVSIGRQTDNTAARTQRLFCCSDWHTCSLCSEPVHPSIQPLPLSHFCFPVLPLALSDSDGVSNKQSLSLATSAQLKTTGIVQQAFVYRNLQVSIDPTAFSTFFFLSLPLSFSH